MLESRLILELIWAFWNRRRGNGRSDPPGDSSRRPARFAAVTFLIILANSFVFFMELAGRRSLCLQMVRHPRAASFFGHHWITLFTSMFLHGSWLHIIGNMIYLWAFGPAIEDAMGRGRYLLFYIAGWQWP